MKRHNSSNLLISHLKNEGNFFVFFHFFAQKEVQKGPKRGPKRGPGRDHDPRLTAKRGVFFSKISKTVDTFSENMHAAFDAVRPPYAACIFSVKSVTGQDGHIPFLIALLVAMQPPMAMHRHCNMF